MATVNVTTFAEFSQAVTVSGDTVVCPQNAVWDMNEIAPEGTTIPTITCTKIEGNGTTIKNLRTNGQIITNSGSKQTIDALHLENFIYTGDAEYFMQPNATYYGVSWMHDIRNCRFSGVLPTATRAFSGGDDYNHGYFTSCAFSLSFLYNGNRTVYVSKRGGIYCNIRIHAPNALTLDVTKIRWSRVKADFPSATSMYIADAGANVYDGDMPQVASTTQTPYTSYISVFNKTTIPNLANGTYMKGVTEAQLHDAEYLYSIGFPIGVEE